MNKLLNCQNLLQIAFDYAIIITVTGAALVTTNIIAARAAPMRRKGYIWQDRKRKALLTATLSLREL